MAVVHLKSTPIANADARPRVANNPSIAGGFVRTAVGQVTTSASDDIASTYRFVRVPSHARIKAVIFASAASGATGQVNIGVYQTAENGGAVVDADFFASNLDPGGGAIDPTDVTHESGEYTLAEGMMPLWQALGLAADPGRDFDIAATVTEAVANATSMKLEVEYVV
jgi:hypothetical protein